MDAIVKKKRPEAALGSTALKLCCFSSDTYQHVQPFKYGNVNKIVLKTTKNLFNLALVYAYNYLSFLKFSHFIGIYLINTLGSTVKSFSPKYVLF